MEYELYIVDTETTGLDPYKHDVIELSLIRLSTQEQKTWFIRPINVNNCDPGALRVNGHKIEDLRGETRHGRDAYMEANKAIIEVENWIVEDSVPNEKRVLVGQNCPFDKSMLEHLWNKCNSKDSFPFGRRYLDTQVIEFFQDWCRGSMAEGYSLSNLVKKYGVKNEKAHSAAADTKVTKEVFEKQVDFFKSVLKSGT
jgi:DNA polymerase III epsilon subunit-like protein